MEIFSICILIAPEDANCFVKKVSSNGMRGKIKRDVSKLSSYKRQRGRATVKFLYTEDNGSNLIYCPLEWAPGRNTWGMLVSPRRGKWE